MRKISAVVFMLFFSFSLVLPVAGYYGDTTVSYYSTTPAAGEYEPWTTAQYTVTYMTTATAPSNTQPQYPGTVTADGTYFT